MYTKINEAYEYIHSRYDGKIDIAIILGSGLGPLADEIENPIIIDYQIFPISLFLQFPVMKENFILEQLPIKQYVL